MFKNKEELKEVLGLWPFWEKREKRGAVFVGLKESWFSRDLKKGRRGCNLYSEEGGGVFFWLFNLFVKEG